MKTLYRFLSMIMCGMFLMTAFSCTKEEGTNEGIDGSTDGTDIPEGYEKITLSATCDSGDDAEVGSKTALDNGNTVWSAEDVIKVYYGSSSSNFELTSGAGTRNGLFSGVASSAPEYAVYPAGVSSSLSGSTVSVTIPATQTGTFGSGNIATAKVVNGDMSFANVNAFISIITTADIHHIVVTSVSGGALAGTVPVSYVSGSADYGAATGTASSIRLNTNSKAGTYYISIVPGVTHSEGLTIAYYTAENTLSNTYYLRKSVVATRNKIIEMGSFVPDGKNYYVTTSGAGNGSGISWANAMSGAKLKTLVTPDGDASKQAAKIAAIDGATFHIGAGTYYFGSDPTIDFSESSQVSITFKGDYPATGGAQDRSGAYRAVFSGTNPQNSSEKGAALKLRGKVNIAFDGISFENGYGTADEAEAGVAAALDCYSSGSDGANISVTMSYCSVKNNTNAYYNTNTDKWGAGVRLMNVSSFQADHVTFAHNTSRAAPALSIRNASVILTDCEFSENQSSYDCGAMFVTSGASVTLTDCTFSNNQASNENGAGSNEDYNKGLGGAIKCRDGGTLTLTGGSFSGNKAWKGGAIWVHNSGSDSKIVWATGTSFSNNGGANARCGGAIYAEAGFTLDDCTFSGNTAVCWGGAIDMEASKNFYIRGGTFSDNAVTGSSDGNGGGALHSVRGALQMTNKTTGLSFTGNTSAGIGGAIYLESTTASNKTSFGNVSFSNNSSDLEGGAVYVKVQKVTIHDASFTGNHASHGGAMLIASDAEIYKTQFNSNYALGGGALRIDQSSGKHAWLDRCSFSGNYITQSDQQGTTISVAESDEFCMNNCSINDNTYNVNAANNFSRPSWVKIAAAKSMISNCSFIGNVRKGENGGTIITGVGSMVYIDPSVAANKCTFINSIVACNRHSFQSWNDSGYGHVVLYYTHYNWTKDLTVDSRTAGLSGVTNAGIGNASWSSNCWIWNGQISGSSEYDKATAGDVLSQMNAVSSSFVSWLDSDKYLDGRSVMRGTGKDTDEWWPGSYQQ
jgi:predicted outer membrane repeat protein